MNVWVRDDKWQVILVKYLSHSAIQADMETQLPQPVSSQGHIDCLTSQRQRLQREHVWSIKHYIYSITRSLRVYFNRIFFSDKASSNSTKGGVFFWINTKLAGVQEISFSQHVIHYISHGLSENEMALSHLHCAAQIHCQSKIYIFKLKKSPSNHK